MADNAIGLNEIAAAVRVQTQSFRRGTRRHAPANAVRQDPINEYYLPLAGNTSQIRSAHRHPAQADSLPVAGFSSQTQADVVIMSLAKQ
jgi:hypothetical protein